MPEWPAWRSLVEVYVYILACFLHRKPQPYPLAIFYSDASTKSCIRMVTLTYPVLGDSLLDAGSG